MRSRMATLGQSILRKLVRDTRGAEIAEAAAVLPLMFMMLLGIFWFGQAFSIYGTITRAAPGRCPRRRRAPVHDLRRSGQSRHKCSGRGAECALLCET